MLLLNGCQVSCLHECETWSLTPREEHRLRVSENRVLRRIFGPKADKVVRTWRKWRNEKRHNFHNNYLGYYIKQMKWRARNMY